MPIDSVGEIGGTELGPERLRDLLAGTGFADEGDTGQRIRSSVRDPGTGWVGFDEVLEVTEEVRGRIGEMVGSGRVPIVLGGCCTLVPAALAGVRDCFDGELGLAYVDGHLDLLTGESSPTGEAADMPVAALLGEAPPALLDRLGQTPLVRPERIALLGARDEEERRLVGDGLDSRPFGTVIDREGLRGADLEAIGRRVETELVSGAARRVGDPPARFWLQLDVDVLGEDEFPATDYLMPDGLAMGELEQLIRPLAASPGLIGLSVTCFNPEKDPTGACGRELAGMLARSLS